MSIRVDLQKLHPPYLLVDGQANGGVISSAELILEPKELVPSGGFEGTISPWVFWKDHAPLESTVNTAEPNYDEARSGNSSAKITFNTSTDAFVIDLFGSTENLSRIRSRQMTFSFWAKNATAGDISFYIDADDGDDVTTYSGDSLPTIVASSSWTKYTFQRIYFFDDEAEYFAVGFKKAAGSGSVLIDDFSIVVDEEYELALNGTFESNTTGWAFANNANNLDANPDNVATRINTDSVGGSWCVKIDFGNTGGYGYRNNAFAITNNFQTLNKAYFVFEVWVKTTSPNITLLVELTGDYTYEGDSLTPAVIGDGTWHKYEVRGKFAIVSTVTQFTVGVKKADGAPIATVYMDSARLYTEPDLTSVPTATVVNLSPALVYSGYANLVGSRMVFTTGDNRNYGSIISEIVNVGSSVSQISLVEAMPVAPLAGDRFSLLVPNPDWDNGNGASTMRSVTDYLIEGMTVSSTAEDGYKSATIELDARVIGKALMSPNVIGWKLLVGSPFGPVWEGLVTSYTIADNKLTLTASGLKSTLGYIRYIGYFDSDAGNTMPFIVKDILSGCPHILFTDASIDRGDVIDTIQTANGGIGPFDFAEQPVLAADAIDSIMRIGFYGDDSLDEAALQVWDNGMAYIKRLKREPLLSDANWFITGSDVYSKQEVSIGVNRDGYGNVFYGSYRGEEGENLETAGVYNLRDVAENGVFDKQISTGSLTEGEIHLAMEVQTQTKAPTASVGDITVQGDIKRSGSGQPIPSYMIKGGDIIFLSDPVRLSTVSAVGDSFAQAIIVGEVSIDFDTKTARITPRDRTDKVETLANQLEINIG